MKSMFLRLPVRTSGIAMAAATASGNNRLANAAAPAHGVSTKMRPASHRAASHTSGGPRSGGCCVHAATAVNRKPAMTAVEKPNSISWPCHSGPPR